MFICSNEISLCSQTRLVSLRVYNIFIVNFIFIKIVIKELQEKPYLSMHANLYSLSTLTDGGDDALYRDELLDFAKFEANPDSPESIVSKKNNNNTININ